MSSSSFGRDGSVALLLAESFAVLAQESPEAYRLMCERLDGFNVGITVAPERLVAAFAAGRARVLEDVDSTTVQIETTRAAILSVIDGERTLADSVLHGRVRARASLDDLVAVNGGLSMYVKGAVRCPSFPALLQRFRETESAADREGSHGC